ncbi:MAG: hypothetical protein HZB10_03775 [Candidatus Yonathbacteria bacterium]|nr:hypothetical protein [Candidatus Yonathbacteria bacterium]
MNRIIIFLVIVYLVSALGAWALFSKNVGTNATLSREIAMIKIELDGAKTAIEAEKTSRVAIEKRIVNARVNATFLELALCPTLEATNKNAPCIKNSADWLSQTIILGTALASTDAKSNMDALLVALSKKTKPTAKQLYEMLRPVEVIALRDISTALK